MAVKEREAEAVQEALEAGLELESRGIGFYSRAAQEVRDPKGRQTLLFLAEEEREHREFIRELLESLKERDDSLLKGAVQKQRARKDTRVFPELEEYVEEIRDSRGDRKILDEAAEIEKRSIEFYREAGKDIENRDYQEIFRILIKEEEGHLALVRQMADYMVLHGVWSGLEDYFANE
ncbi:MAG: hypothetical protein D6733_03330 [Methanobacteriota archaeon]|nr:MAG: hypothetical protein D6733_03330 [Euryarchaeota archaeon]